MFDLVIIGSGSAGLSAAIYASRAGLDFVLLDQDGYGGGQISTAHSVQNYPGLTSLAGADLAENFREHALSLGAEVKLAVVVNVSKVNDYFVIRLDDESTIETKSVIAATGSTPRKLGVNGEEELLGRGVSYCAVCDGAFFTGKDVVVIGGGDTAVEDALYLAGICSHVTLIYRRNTLRAAATRIAKLKELPNVEILYNSTVTNIIGENMVESITVTCASGDYSLDTSAVFVAVGTLPATDYLNELGANVDNGYICASEDCVTSVPGLFAAGDIRTKPLRQVVSAVADGANAVYSAVYYLG